MKFNPSQACHFVYYYYQMQQILMATFNFIYKLVILFSSNYDCKGKKWANKIINDCFQFHVKIEYRILDIYI